MHSCRRESERVLTRAGDLRLLLGKKELSTQLPPGVRELREVVNALDGENGRTLLRVEWGGTRG